MMMTIMMFAQNQSDGPIKLSLAMNLSHLTTAISQTAATAAAAAVVPIAPKPQVPTTIAAGCSFADDNNNNSNNSNGSSESSTDDEQLYVNLSTFWYCFLAFITILGLLVALVSNMIVIYLFTKTPYMRRNPSNIIAVNLSLSDLLYCTQWPSVIYCSLTQSTWILEIDFVCQTFGFLTVSTALASILTVLALSIERAIVITNSIHAKQRFTIRGAWFIVILIWIVSICSCLPPLFGKFNRYTLDPSKTSCTLDYLSSKTNHKLYILILYIAYWIAPAIIITICYILIIVTFKQSSKSLRLVSDKTVQPAPTYNGSEPVATIGQLARQRAHLAKSTTSINSLGPGSLSAANSTRRKMRDSIRLKRAFDNYFKRCESQHQQQQQQQHQLNGNDNDREDNGEHKHDDAEAIRGEQSTTTTTTLTSISTLTPLAALCAPHHQGKRHHLSIGTTRSKTCHELRIAVAPLAASVRLTRAGRQSEDPRAGRKAGGADRGEEQMVSSMEIATTTLQQQQQQPPPPAATSTACHVGASSSQHSRTGIQFRLAKMSFYLILLWLVSWTPIASLAMINSVVRCHHRASALAVFTANTMTKLGPTFDVFIYGISHPKIKCKFKQIIKWLLLIDRTSSSSGSTSIDNNNLNKRVFERSKRISYRSAAGGGQL